MFLTIYKFIFPAGTLGVAVYLVLGIAREHRSGLVVLADILAPPTCFTLVLNIAV